MCGANVSGSSGARQDTELGPIRLLKACRAAPADSRIARGQRFQNQSPVPAAGNQRRGFNSWLHSRLTVPIIAPSEMPASPIRFGV